VARVLVHFERLLEETRLTSEWSLGSTS